LVDCRIHVILFFFGGMKLKINDVIYMKKLQKMTNIIPIYSCNDIEMDQDEILDLKWSLSKDARDYQLTWVDFAKSIDIEKICDEKELVYLDPLPPF
jgi:septin family protein